MKVDCSTCIPNNNTNVYGNYSQENVFTQFEGSVRKHYIKHCDCIGKWFVRKLTLLPLTKHIRNSSIGM